jgi:GT2 family glycosyltransferase
MGSAPRDAELDLSVVIATYNRAHLIAPLIEDLERQTLTPDRFEVILVDDGSKTPVKPILDARPSTLRLRVVEQENGGPAAARHHGIAESRADIVVIVDDDMRLAPDFLASHLRRHREGFTVVLGHIRPDPKLDGMPLFERFHAQQLDKQVAGFRSGKAARGVHLCTGNVSFRRADYLAVGGFDRELARSEDRDLGIRLEHAGARIAFAEEAYTVHGSDHTKLEVWLRRAFLYGVYDSRIGSKHARVSSVSPWRFFFLVNPVSRPLLLLSAAVPPAGHALARGIMSVSEWLDARGMEGLAIKGTTLVYGLEYFCGIRHDAGSLAAAARGLWSYARDRDPVPRV